MGHHRILPGDYITVRELTAVTGEEVTIPDGKHVTHLQFRRFAGCPVCNLHLQSFVRRYNELWDSSIREVVVFHSTAAALLPHTGDLPFAVIADPNKELYREFGVESSLRSLIDPRAWLPIVRGILNSLAGMLRKRWPMPPLNPEGGRLGLPADLLIAGDGRVVAVHYGGHAYDQWAVDEVLELASADGNKVPAGVNSRPLGEGA